MSLEDYERWIKLAQELGHSGEDMRSFVKEKHAEAKKENLIEREKAQLELDEKCRLVEVALAEKRRLEETIDEDSRMADESSYKKIVIDKVRCEKKQGLNTNDKFCRDKPLLSSKVRYVENENKGKSTELINDWGRKRVHEKGMWNPELSVNEGKNPKWFRDGKRAKGRNFRRDCVIDCRGNKTNVAQWKNHTKSRGDCLDWRKLNPRNDLGNQATSETGYSVQRIKGLQKNVSLNIKG